MVMCEVCSTDVGPVGVRIQENGIFRIASGVNKESVYSLCVREQKINKKRNKNGCNS